MDRPRQMLLPLFTEPCYVCGYVFYEGLKGRWALPILHLRDDLLCVSHRARLQEGACLFCGRRLAWLHMAADPELAICRPCFVDRRGEAVAQAVEAMQNGDALGLLD
jgi:hypothetical protein